MMRWIIRLAVVLALAGMAAGGFLLWAHSRLGTPGPAPAAVTVVIPHGTGSSAIAQQLQDAGVIDASWLFLLGTRMTGKQPLQAGEYAFPAQISLASVIDMMRRGQVVIHKLTIAEGLTVQQILTQLRQADGLSGKISLPPEEGSLMPQTYYYSLGDSRDAVLARMGRAMTENLEELWPKRARSLALNKIEALTLASIVERETALPEERPHVAAVFLNRLKLHMRLQSDPTAIYALSNGQGVLDRPLKHDDLAIRSPYNTYVADGLPPGPICNPGRASLAAVLNPATSDDLYFVADGTGGHIFAKTLAEHNRNVTRWRVINKPAAVDDGEDEEEAPPPTKKVVKGRR
jgi:UPF0755 protein